MKSTLLLSLLAWTAMAQNDSGPEAVKPIVTWTFDAKELGTVLGSEAGPRPPSYPGFAATNLAYRCTNGITVTEADAKGVNLRFTNGEAITLEAWVKPENLADGAYVYIVGKGRTKKTDKNQNYALRLTTQKGRGRISFLFASEDNWHRWTSTEDFTPTGWHHVAVSYTFGDPTSIHGFIDGKLVGGAWDMGGATTKPPVSDGSDLQIGTGNGGGVANTFQGFLDNISVWRTIIPDAVLTTRFQHVTPPPVVNPKNLPAGQVLVQLCEQGLEKNAWPIAPPPPKETYVENAFGFFDVPQKYVEGGVRGERANPFLLRAAANITLPAGTHHFLLRGRGASRLYLDGTLLLSTPFPPTDTSGHGYVKNQKYLNLGPSFRFAPPGNRENHGTFAISAGTHVVILETIVGGVLGKSSHRRPELGETVAAIALEKSTDWNLLTPGRSVPYTDAGWAAYEAERTAQYESVDAKARAASRREHSAYWDKRHALAAEWLAASHPEAVPASTKEIAAHNAIDHFLNAAIAKAIEEKAAAKNDTVSYFKEVQPLLESKCYGCHVGANAKGKLRLDNHASALVGGKSDGPAVAPGKPEASAIIARCVSKDDDDRMPPKGEPLTAEQIKTLETWIREGARWPSINAEQTTVTPLADDLTFLRRVYLDTVGVVPMLAEIEEFQRESSRSKLIDKLLADPRCADHAMGYWLDVFAENPNILNPTLNNTGPFRWWLYEALRDNLPADEFATQLLRMRGSERFGGPAGFAVASQNDAPFAAKGTIVSAAFLGVEMKCARCHDAPSHASTQENLFSLAAMLSTKPEKVPLTSSVPMDKLHEGGRKPLIQVTLKPGTVVKPQWPFPQFVKEAEADKLAEYPNDPRDRLAALVTAPQNERFAQVMVNRLWARLMGRGIVEPVDDWEKGKASHPELLRWLSRELVRNNYDTRAVARLILSSHAYQRACDPAAKTTGVLFAAPSKRRLGAEQIVDSLFVATGKPFTLEEVSLDLDGVREQNQSLTLGIPRRSWMLTSTSNERDRPSLSLPRLQPVTDVLTAYGWRGARQDPTSVRDHAPNVLQPAILANGIMGLWLTRLSEDHSFVPVALNAKDPGAIVDELFLRAFTRKPSPAERDKYVKYLSEGFDTRAIDSPPRQVVHKPQPFVSWSNHLDPKANEMKVEQETKLREGDPPTTRLNEAWRQRLENVIWATVNSPEMVHRP